MRLKSFDVIGLLGRDAPLRLDFHDDINIITGRNGSGKTTILKLLWYVLSGNILLALREVNFKKATLETSEYQCTIYRLSAITCRIDWHDRNGSKVFEDIRDGDDDTMVNAEDIANEILVGVGSSVFFPTFRRIEGGFTLGDRATGPIARARGDIEEMLIALSKRLSNNRHLFVASLSTVDVVSLLVRQYTDISDVYNALQQKTSHQIIGRIKDFKHDQPSADQLEAANTILDEVRAQIEGMEAQRESLMRPLDAVRRLVMQLFRHSGIQLSKNLSFGDAAHAVNSDSLSAGEKQMLSFIAYNAFYADSIFLIDEPELSLHVDWQRQLISILLAQQQSNQFVIATHSPFIYGKYPDKELLIDSDRGDVVP